MKLTWLLACVVAAALPCSARAEDHPNRHAWDKQIATHAKANLVPEALVHRVIAKESKYHPNLVWRGGRNVSKNFLWVDRGLRFLRPDPLPAATPAPPGVPGVLTPGQLPAETVNDRLGHTAGDQVLCEVAARMAECLRSADTIGRWGGDEFLVIAERLEQPGAGQELAERLRASLDQPIIIAGEELGVQAMVGVAHLSDHCYADELVQAADQALLRARAAGGSRLAR